ncbi:hypothetical protein GJU40_16810 [Bacillus lacus]|uniref:DUF218 domain-containing protein n=1 Tax=Metabacillus lacus TaxID=1983721 RepID=A0A7X2LYP9_9BACI|nr:YdcF family protein [Metabacillus lacus]MRX73805.1 hypothetical protein [Metabacillus lacus]
MISYKKICLVLLSIMIVMLFIFGISFGLIFIAANIAVLFLLLLLWKKKQAVSNQRKGRPAVLLFLLYLLFVLSFILVESFIFYEAQAGGAVKEQDYDFVLVLGAGLNGDQPSLTLLGRLEAAQQYLQGREHPPIIVSGGQGPRETITEAKAMGRYFIEAGIDESLILYEEASTSTQENIAFSKKLMEEEGIQMPNVLIVTSDFHLARAKLICKQEGMVCEGLAGESPFFITVNYYIREYFGVCRQLVAGVLD